VWSLLVVVGVALTPLKGDAYCCLDSVVTKKRVGYIFNVVCSSGSCINRWYIHVACSGGVLACMWVRLVLGA
jgi:hypothetical protein